MLLRTMVLLAFVGVLGETLVYAAAALARVNVYAKERSAVRSAFSAGVLQAQQAAISGTIPAPSATCAYGDEHGCEITVRTTVSAATPAPAATPAGCPNTACTIYEQANSHVAEGRASYRISESVLTGNADVVMTRSAAVSFRTFAAPPYASLAGSIDATLDALDRGGASDDGGNASAAASTLIHVEYRQAGAPGVNTPADVWRVQDQHPATTTPGWEY